MNPASVVINLQNIHCFNEADGSPTAEPYLWTVFFKIDGDTAYVDDNLTLQGTATVIGTPGNHGNLINTDVDAGDDVPIPDRLGTFETVLTPIPLRTPILGVENVGGFVGCLVVLLEEDNTPDSAVAAGHDALNNAVQDALNSLIPTLNFLHQEPTEEEIEKYNDSISSAVRSAIEDNVSIFDYLGGFGNMDDQIGFDLFRFSQKELVDAGPAGIPIYKRWKQEGDWDISGFIVGIEQVPPEPQPAFMISPATLDLGELPRGTIATRDHVFTVSSVGTAPVTIQSITLQGPQASAFSVAPDARIQLPITLQPGESFTISLSFISTVLGQHTAAVVVTGLLRVSDPPVQMRAELLANCVAPIIDVLPQSINFGNRIIGSSTTRNMLVANSGPAELKWRIASSTQHQFKWPVNLSNSWQTLAPGASEIVQLRFEPTTDGNHSDRIIIESNDRTVEVLLLGMGVPAPQPRISVAPDPITFGLAYVGDRISRNVTISNHGDAPLTVNNIILTGSAAFNLQQPVRPFTVEPLVANPAAGTRVVAITFQPLTPGEHNGTLHISSNAPDPVVSVQLFGVTPAADVFISLNSIYYGAIIKGIGKQVHTREVIIYNVGAAPMTCDLRITNERNNTTGSAVNAFRVHGARLAQPGGQQPVPFSADGKSLSIPAVGGAPAAVPPGYYLSLDVAFSPGSRAVGTLTADLTILTNDPDTPTLTVSLRGIGIALQRIPRSIDSLSL